MLGIFDRYFARKMRKRLANPAYDWTPEVQSFDYRKVTWLCFAPRQVTQIPWFRRRIIPMEGTVIVYTITSTHIIVPDPDEVVAKLTAIYQDAVARLNQAHKQGNVICLLGISLGNVLSIRLAGESGIQLGRLISLIGGGHLGLSGWDSILTGQIARKSGCISKQEYEQALSVFSPVHYVHEINLLNARVRIASHDLFIPFVHGESLAIAFAQRSKAMGQQLDHKIYHCADHSSGIILSALEKVNRY